MIRYNPRPADVLPGKTVYIWDFGADTLNTLNRGGRFLLGIFCKTSKSLEMSARFDTLEAAQEAFFDIFQRETPWEIEEQVRDGFVRLLTGSQKLNVCREPVGGVVFDAFTEIKSQYEL